MSLSLSLSVFLQLIFRKKLNYKGWMIVWGRQVIERQMIWGKRSFFIPALCIFVPKKKKKSAKYGLN